MKARGGNFLLGHGTHLVWKMEGQAANLLLMNDIAF
jgi:hypothetical protein